MGKIINSPNPTNPEDLNDINNLTGGGSIKADKRFGPVKDGEEGKEEYLKGALSPFKISNLSKAQPIVGNSDNYGGNTLITIINFFNSLLENSMELLTWEGLPKGLDKYVLEYPLRTDGVVGVLKWKDTFYACNVSLDYTKESNNQFKNIGNSFINVGYRPTTAKVVSINNENLKILLKDKPLKVGEEIFIIRNTLNKSSMYTKAYRFLQLYEAIIFQIEKNNKVSAPKVGIIDDNPVDSGQSENNKKSWNNTVVSDNSAFVMNFNADLLSRLKEVNIKEPWFPMELKNQINELVTSFQWIKNELKELFGFEILDLGGKKEKALNVEVNVSNGISKYYFIHMLNIRKNDIKPINEFFGLNIVVKDDQVDINQGKEEEKNESPT